ncbi:MAG TPA: hypothetical protein VIZ69_01150 [Thermoanaerobaculia bacterium]
MFRFGISGLPVVFGAQAVESPGGSSCEVKAQFEDTKGTGRLVKGRECEVEFYKR